MALAADWGCDRISPTDPKKSLYQAMENQYKGNVFLAITSADAATGIVIDAEDTKRELDNDPTHFPDHGLFKVTAKTYGTEPKETYSFHYIEKQP
jgi:hypothetical protein